MPGIFKNVGQFIFHIRECFISINEKKTRMTKLDSRRDNDVPLCDNIISLLISVTIFFPRIFYFHFSNLFMLNTSLKILYILQNTK